MVATKVTSGVRSLTTAEVSAAGITGEIRMWSTATPPSGWLMCDASAVSRTVTYDGLFAVIGTTFGTGDGSTTFNVPDFRGRVPVGVGTGDASDATAFALADKDGEEAVALTEAELASHTHNTDIYATLNPSQNTNGSGSQNVIHTAGTTSTESDAAGSGTAHGNLQPSLGIHFIIKI